MSSLPFDGDLAKQAVVTVNLEGRGRGFVVEIDGAKYVITAVHCLPALPDFESPRKFYSNLISTSLNLPLSKGQRALSAQCVFCDVVSDLAVLSAGQEEGWDAESMSFFLNTASIPTASPPKFDGNAESDFRGWLLSPAGDWFECRLRDLDEGLHIIGAKQDIVGGMSGSPILNDDGAAVGVVSSSEERAKREGGPNPCLFDSLPGRFQAEQRTTLRTIVGALSGYTASLLSRLGKIAAGRSS